MGRLVIIGRLLLLLAAAAAAVSAFILSRGYDRAASGFAGPYVCPMHREATSEVPGECPICRMALERVGASGPLDGAGPAGDTTFVDGAPSYSFPDSANLPNYKLIAGAKRRVVARGVRAPAWLEAGGVVVAVLYNDELTGLAPGERGLFLPASPAAGVGVRLTAEPPARWDASTSRVRFRVDAGVPVPGNGTVGWVTLTAKPRELLVVPSSAITNTPQGPYVLVASTDGRTFTPRPVEIGRVLSGLAVVVSGLRDHERVVVGNTFFLDAERRLRADGEEGPR